MATIKTLDSVTPILCESCKRRIGDCVCVVKHNSKKMVLPMEWEDYFFMDGTVNKGDLNVSASN